MSKKSSNKEGKRWNSYKNAISGIVSQFPSAEREEAREH